MADLRVMTLGLSHELKSEIARIAPDAKFQDSPYDLNSLLDPVDPQPHVILCAPPPAPTSPSEVAQLLRGVYIQSGIFMVLSVTQKMDRQILLKNGFTDVFFLPIDANNLKKALDEGAAVAGSGAVAFRKVKLVDVEPNTVLDFNTFLYLPANKKHVKFSSAGDPIDAERTQRLKTHSVSTLSVRVDEIKKFYSYVAGALKKSKNASHLSETERAERTEGAVRNLLTDLFSDANTSMEAGKQTIADLQGIIKQYLDTGEEGSGAFYNKILQVTAQGDSAYNHAVNVSTLGALFSIALNLGQAEDIAIAGVLHDLGLAGIPREVLRTPPSEWLPVDREIFQLHPERTITLIRERKLVVSDNVHKAILQHHERFGGGGFPKGLSGERICPEAQILAIADDLDERTTPVDGKPAAAPRKAMEAMIAEAEKAPSNAAHDVKLLRKIASLMHGEESSKCA